MVRKKLEGTYYSRHKAHADSVSLAWYYRNRDKINERKRLMRAAAGYVRPRRSYIYKADHGEAKAQVLAKYGQVCECCNESTRQLLTVDHINDNGKEHGTAKSRYKGALLYRHLISLNFPEGIRILCFNCNIGRRNNRGICPHKGEKANGIIAQ